MIRHSFDLLKIYNHMKREENRYGMEIKIEDMIKISKIWRNCNIDESIENHVKGKYYLP